MKKQKIIHFVYGGGSGATLKAEEIAIGNKQGNFFEPYMVYHGQAKNKQTMSDYGIPFWEVEAQRKMELIKELTKVIKEINPDIVISHGYKEHIFGRIASLRAKVPIIIQVEHNSQPYAILYYLLSFVLSFFTNRIICVSHAVKEHLLNLFFFNKHKMHVIYNGFYIDRFFNETPLTSRLPGVLMIARFSSQKDHITLIKAAKIMKDKKKSCPIYFIGDGSRKHFDKSQKLVEKLGLEDTVHFLGRREDVPELLAKYQISVLSTHYEGLSGVIMEAMAAGNVVIATNAPGVTELITHEKTGFLVPPKSPEILADRIISVLEHPEKYTQIVESAQKYILENFNVDIMVKNYEQVFREEYSKYINKK